MTADLMLGDCLDLLKDLPDASIDMVLCDPPYGIDYQSHSRKNKDEWKPKIKNDKKPFIDFIPMVKRLLKTTGCVMIFTRWDVQQVFIDAMAGADLKPQNVIIWDKKMNGMGDLKRAFGSRYESIIFHAEHDFRFQNKRPRDLVCFPRVPAQKLVHPNEKPVELLEWCITNCVPEAGVVLDMCMGSGSTGVAAMNTGRNFIGIELDETYYEISKTRIRR